MFALDQTHLFNHHQVFYNEHVVLQGDWQYGKFYFVAFGSSTVGSSIINFDPTLRTNVLGETWRKEEPA